MTASQQRPKVVIIGAGFAGLVAARHLSNQPVDVLLVDRNNYHTFTPLLYQVATCGLDPSEIAYPVRSIFRKSKNVSFLLGEVTGIDPQTHTVRINTGESVHDHPYDFLVLAAGSITNYFGNQTIEQHGFGLKDLGDAVVLRNHILRLIESAAWNEDTAQRQALTTLVVVGGGPTGLETAGALYELYNYMLRQEYRNALDLEARVILIEATDNLLQPYPPNLQRAALKQLQSLGVQVMLGEVVESVAEDHVRLRSGQVIPTHTLVWAAGVQGSPLAAMLDVEAQRGRRIPVDPTLKVIGFDTIYAAGDLTYILDEKGQTYPQMIPVAQQQGKRVARNILRRLKNQPEVAFVYHDRGLMATIGRRRAVAWPYYKVQLTGFIAWVTWLFLHLVWLMGFRNRLTVLVNWVWNYLTYDRSVRIILEPNVQRRVKEPQNEL